ncbi:MAG: acyl carrier protein [Alphaproteobacteria bacterium]
MLLTLAGKYKYSAFLYKQKMRSTFTFFNNLTVLLSTHKKNPSCANPMKRKVGDMENDLKEYLLEISGVEISENDNIMDMGILQSMDYVMLISFIKKKTGVIFSKEDLVADNFRSIIDIVNLLKRKKVN